MPAYSRVAVGDDPAEPFQLVALDRPWAPLAIREDDVFVATYWTTAELVGPDPTLADGGVRPVARPLRLCHPGLRAGILRVVGPMAFGPCDV